MPGSESVAAGTTTCDPTTVKTAKNGGKLLGRTTNFFATDHVFEVHLIGDFIYWLVNQPRNTYSAGAIPWPFAANSGWQRPDAVWCQAVLGSK